MVDILLKGGYEEGFNIEIVDSISGVLCGTYNVAPRLPGRLCNATDGTVTGALFIPDPTKLLCGWGDFIEKGTHNLGSGEGREYSIHAFNESISLEIYGKIGGESYVVCFDNVRIPVFAV